MDKTANKKNDKSATSEQTEEVKNNTQKDDPKEENNADGQEEVKTVRAKTAQEMKAMVRPEFQKNYQNYYPTKVMEKFKFSRAQCPKCQNYYWRHTEARDTCGDSNCVGKYQFIGKGCGIGLKGQKLTYAGAYKTFQKSFTTARIPCTAIKRYPVVARWRNDVDYVAAGIYCFQPYCVTGELEPPANPLICPQFCVRFNDLDNIGLTGRHYSGFVMLGIQVFNLPDKFIFFDEECVEFNLRWLIEELQIDPDEITLIEDVWSGGGNLGSSIEYFIRGMEIGNMVFMRYKYFPDGRLQELPVKVIDTGIGLERIPWLINGSPTSYLDIFPNTIQYLSEKLSINMNAEVWAKLGPYSCLLNIDEVENIDKTWALIAETINVPLEDVKSAIIPVKDLYIICDHTRTVMMIIIDGSLPSNVGGGSNVRNIIRRVFAILSKNKWWEPLCGEVDKKTGKVQSLKGFLDLFEYHKKDLEELYGEFQPYKSFEKIVTLEYERWSTTDSSMKSKLDNLIKKREKEKKTLSIDDWILAMESYGIPADTIAQISNQPIPGNLYYEIAYRQEKFVKAPEEILYNTSHLKQTVNIYYDNQKLLKFPAQIVEIFANQTQDYALNIVILDQSQFYPTSGGQQHDTGSLTIEGVTYKVVNCIKVGPCVLHILDKPLPGAASDYVGKEIRGEVDEERRRTLRNHHTGTHIIFAACRQVLGPHVWQNGAKKTIDEAHLDITHFASLTYQEEIEIETEANRIIMSGQNIDKRFRDKAEAEQEHGFRLYQGGIVPGSTLRIVNIEDTDVEACCGTHCDNTVEVGYIKLINTRRISDGILRLTYVAGSLSIEKIRGETIILNKLQESWKVPEKDILNTASQFFDERNTFGKECDEQKKKIVQLQIELVTYRPQQNTYIISDEDNPGLYISLLGSYAKVLKEKKKGIVYVGKNFVYALFGEKDAFDHTELLKLLKADNQKAAINVVNSIDAGSKKAQEVIPDVLLVKHIGPINVNKVKAFLENLKFEAGI